MFLLISAQTLAPLWATAVYSSGKHQLLDKSSTKSLHMFDQISHRPYFFGIHIWFLVNHMTCSPKLKTDRHRLSLPHGTNQRQPANIHSCWRAFLYNVQRHLFSNPLLLPRLCISLWTQNLPTLLFRHSKNVITCTYGQRLEPPQVSWLSVGLWQSGPMWFHSAFKAIPAGKTTVLSWWVFGFFQASGRQRSRSVYSDVFFCRSTGILVPFLFRSHSL